MKQEDYVHCPECGAILPFDPSLGEVKCESCGNVFKIDAPPHISEAEEELRRNNTRMATIIAICLLLPFLAIPIFMSLVAPSRHRDVSEYTYSEEKETIDPFEGTQILFSGVNGVGVADMSDKPHVWFEIEPSYSLHNGDVVTVTAESFYYNLSRTTKTYTVVNLAEYLQDPNTISDNMLGVLDKFTQQLINDNAVDISTLARYPKDSFTEWRRVGIYVLYADDTNIVYDCWSCNWNSTYGVELHPVFVATYTDLVLYPETSNIKYSYSTYKGNVLYSYTQVGEPYQTIDTDHYFRGYWNMEAVERDLVIRQDSSTPMQYKYRGF